MFECHSSVLLSTRSLHYSPHIQEQKLRERHTRSSAFCTMEDTLATPLEGRAVLSQKSSPFFRRPVVKLPHLQKINCYQCGRTSSWVFRSLWKGPLAPVCYNLSCSHRWFLWFFFLTSFYSLDKGSFCHKGNVLAEKVFNRQNHGFPHFPSLPRRKVLS